MKALEILKDLKSEMQDNEGIINWDCSYEYFKKVDKAIKELEDSQNRICYSCKYILDTETVGNFCEYNDRCSDDGISVDYVRDIKNFCCNRWENND